MVLVFNFDATNDEQIATDTVQPQESPENYLTVMELAKGIGFFSEQNVTLQSLNVTIRLASIKVFNEISKGMEWLVDRI